MIARRTLQESWDFFASQGWNLSRTAEGQPLLPDHVPTISGDPAVGLSYFRTRLNDEQLTDLTIPRIFFSRSYIEGVSFRNSDLDQSAMCWNDFTDCDFTDADLTCCDMRASIFQDCRFVRCKLIGADLRRSTFVNCDFTDADLTGAVVDSEQDLELSDDQWEQVDFRADEGPEPEGG